LPRQILIFIFMDTVVIMPHLQRAGTFTKSDPEKVLDAYFISLTKQIEAGLKPSLRFEEVEEALVSGNVSPDVIDDLEDAMFGVIMEESRNDEYVSREQVMKSLRRR
jgi:hypothetical protein